MPVVILSIARFANMLIIPIFLSLVNGRLLSFLTAISNELLREELLDGIQRILIVAFAVFLFLRINQHSRKSIPAKKSLFPDYGNKRCSVFRKIAFLILVFLFCCATFFITIHFFYYGFIFLKLELTPYLATVPIHKVYLNEPDLPLDILIKGIGIVLVASVVEEIFYRGLMLRACEDAKWSSTSIYAFQFIMFGIVHVDPSAALIYQLIRFTNTGLHAVAYTWLYRRTGSFIYPVLGHFLWNLQSTIKSLTVASGYFDQTELYFFAISFISLVACGGYLLFWLKKNYSKKNHLNIPISLNWEEIKLFFLCTGIFVSNQRLLSEPYESASTSSLIGLSVAVIFIEAIVVLILIVKGSRLHNIPYNEVTRVKKYWGTPLHSLRKSDCESYDFPVEVKRWLDEQIFSRETDQFNSVHEEV
ncbi:MAG: CPBP family intramembrane glutamic endopeptidase [Candidatus Odinarchaeota archaeon]